MEAGEVRQRYLDFFKSKGHAIVPSASLVPENDPTTLFTGSGMQPMIPYLLGEKHPLGTRIADSQKSFRAGDIEEVGDNRHTTFFEMLGNWSFGDYFKEEQISWIFDFLVEDLKLDPKKLYVTCFGGDGEHNLPKDTETPELWKKLFAGVGVSTDVVDVGSEEEGGAKGMQGGRIFYYDSTKNWWSRAGVPGQMPAGEPGGPDSEVFFEFTDVEHNKDFGEHCHPNCDCGRFLEIGNSVFMEYLKQEDGSFVPLANKNVDFGGGLERMAMVTQNKPDIFLANHLYIINELEVLSGKKYTSAEETTKAFRIIADHMKAAIFLIGDGVVPGNTEQGYVLRRLLRRAIRFSDLVGIREGELAKVVGPTALAYKDQYEDLDPKSIIEVIEREEAQFRKTLRRGTKEFEKIVKKGAISGADAFVLFTTYGFPIEVTQEMAEEKGLTIDTEEFESELAKHKEESRMSSVGKFKGGLGDHSDKTVNLHTAHHLLLASLQNVLGKSVKQRGSSITPDRLRIDFSFERKLTDDEKEQIEELVNEKITENLDVVRKEMPLKEAEQIGAEMEFGQKYPDTVSIYFIQDSAGNVFSKEFCGGPHAKSTGGLGKFKIRSEKASSAGVRRIKATLE